MSVLTKKYIRGVRRKDTVSLHNHQVVRGFNYARVSDRTVSGPVGTQSTIGGQGSPKHCSSPSPAGVIRVNDCITDGNRLASMARTNRRFERMGSLRRPIGRSKATRAVPRSANNSAGNRAVGFRVQLFLYLRAGVSRVRQRKFIRLPIDDGSLFRQLPSRRRAHPLCEATLRDRVSDSAREQSWYWLADCVLR